MLAAILDSILTAAYLPSELDPWLNYKWLNRDLG